MKRYLLILLAAINVVSVAAQVSLNVSTPVEVNGDWVVEISMDNPNDVITSLQFDFTFGSDFSYTAGNYSFSSRARKTKYGKEVETHDLVSGSASNGGTVRMIIYSNDNEPIQGTSGTLVTLRLEGLSTAKVTKCNLTNIVAATIVNNEVQYNGFYPQAVIGDSSLACYDVMDDDVLVIGELNATQLEEMNLCLSTNSNVKTVDLSRCTNDELGELSLTSEPTFYLASKGQVSNKGKKYYKRGSEWSVDEVSIIDGVADYASDFDVVAEKATYVRSFNNQNWQAWYTPFVVPVSMTVGELEFAKVVDIKEDEENVYFYCQDVVDGNVEANKPYLVKAAATGAMTMEWKDIKVCKPAVTTTTFTTDKSTFSFTGNYSVKSDMFANGSYALRGGLLAGASSASVVLNPHRWFMDYSTTVQTKKRCALVFGGMVDGIDGISADDVDGNVPMFDVSGRPARSAGSGLYIIKGRKVLMK